MDQDGIDDIGLWVPRANAQNPEAAAEWYFLISADPDANLRITGDVNRLDHPFSTAPFGNDLYAEFGNELAAPIVGNFDPPIADEIPQPDPQIPETADFDEDNDVDGFDFLAWQRGFGMTGASLNDGDADDSTTVDNDDFAVWDFFFW